MEIVVIALAAFAISMLTFFSGFGLGTILTPVFAIFFPIELAIALTGVVHFFNNVFKTFLVGRNADITVLIRFGIPAVIASFIGAWLLLKISSLPVLFDYQIGDHVYKITAVKA
ncbi:MAG TPA: TSUP family transporter, partial [Bacteroidales bacterium]|nr:TSUP family transporter [Bacteroidales bacterium]